MVLEKKDLRRELTKSRFGKEYVDKVVSKVNSAGHYSDSEIEVKTEGKFLLYSIKSIRK